MALIVLATSTVYVTAMLVRTRIPVLRRLVTHKPFPPFRDWHVRPHPSARVPVHAAAWPRQLLAAPADPGTATLVVHTGYSSYPSRAQRVDLQVSRPNVPVVYVDGYPASWGWGITRIAIAAGEHLVAVAGSHSRCYRRLDLVEGETVTLYFSSVLGNGAHRFREPDADLYEGVWFGTSPPAKFTAADRRVTAVVRAVLACVAVLALLGITAELLDSPLEDLVSTGTLITYGAIVSGVCGGLVLVAGAVADALRSPAPPPAADPPGPSTRPDVHVIDYDEPVTPRPAPGWSALCLHLRYELTAHTLEESATAAGRKGRRLNPLQRWRVIRIGEAEVPGGRPWIPPPRVAIDGVAISASWTRMWIQLAPGTHHVSIALDAPQAETGPTTHVDLADARQQHTIVLRTGETHHLAGLATINALPRSEHREMATYHARLS
ncbi:hypothetical protein [Nocardia sp. CA-290969]|uniref:hypothetical protein n=1 Tax=Nocardia sp. CA-290969 TaxID=3239986 RepID=UPI003D903042